MRRFALLLALVVAVPAAAATPFYAAGQRAVIAGVSRDVRSGQLGHRLDKALDALMKKAEAELQAHGGGAAAKGEREAFATQWEGTYRGYLSALDGGEKGAIGQFPPAIAFTQFLAATYVVIEAALGPAVAHAMHFDDLKTVAYTFEVTFFIHPHQADVTEPIYSEHFTAITGVAVYWCTDIGCTIATWGMGYGWACSLAAWGAKEIWVLWVGPELGVWVYRRHAGQL